MKKGYLFLNGIPPSQDILDKIEITANDVTVCADGAYNWVNKFCAPQILIGDFDSINFDLSSINPEIKIEKFPAEKDYTDGHIAMQYLIDCGVTDVMVLGAMGGRIDHALANYSLLYLAYLNNVSAQIIDEQFDVYLACKNFKHSAKIGKLISLVPFSDKVHILYTKGLKYQIDNKTFDRLSIIGISNEAIENTFEYGIISGQALIFIER